MRRMILGSAALLALCLGSLASAADKKDDSKPEKKTETQESRRRPSDVVFILIETSGHDETSAAEIQKMYDILRKLDKNNDGKIDAEALRAAREQIINDRVDYLLKELDTDMDGKISRDEAKGRIKEHFDRIDRDKDGFISKEELRQAISAHRKAPVKD
jgi:Ca2+-binding EF-hand superfamily protein